MAQITYKLGFKVDKSDLKDMEKVFTTVTQALDHDMAKAANSLKDGLVSAKTEGIRQAGLLKKALVDAATDGGISFQKMNRSLKQSGTSAAQIAQSLSGAGMQASLNTFLSTFAQANRHMIVLNEKAREFQRIMKQSVQYSMAQGIQRFVMGQIQGAISWVQQLNAEIVKIGNFAEMSGAQMERTFDRMIVRARELNVTALDYAQAAFIFYQQGLPEAEIDRRAQTVIMAARASLQDITATGQQMTAIWNTYRMSGDEIERAASVAAALSSTTAAQFSDIAQGMQIAASGAAMLGVSYESLAAIMSTVVSVTQQSASVVGNAYKTIFARLTNLRAGGIEDGVDLGQITTQLNQLGVSVLDAAGDLRDLDDVIMEMGLSWDTFSHKHQIAIAQVVGGVRQYQQFLALMSNFDMYLDNMATAEGEIGTEALTRQYMISLQSIDHAKRMMTEEWRQGFANLFPVEAQRIFYEGFRSLGRFIGEVIESLDGLQGILLLAAAIFANKIVPKVVLVKDIVGDWFKGNTLEKQLTQIQSQFGDISDSIQKSMDNVNIEIDAEIRKIKFDGDMEASFLEDNLGDLDGAEQQRKITERLVAQQESLRAAAQQQLKYSQEKVKLSAEHAIEENRLNDIIANGNAKQQAQAKIAKEQLAIQHQQQLAAIDAIQKEEEKNNKIATRLDMLAKVQKIAVTEETDATADAKDLLAMAEQETQAAQEKLELQEKTLENQEKYNMELEAALALKRANLDIMKIEAEEQIRILEIQLEGQKALSQVQGVDQAKVKSQIALFENQLRVKKQIVAQTERTRSAYNDLEEAAVRTFNRTADGVEQARNALNRAVADQAHMAAEVEKTKVVRNQDNKLIQAAAGLMRNLNLEAKDGRDRLGEMHEQSKNLGDGLQEAVKQLKDSPDIFEHLLTDGQTANDILEDFSKQITAAVENSADGEESLGKLVVIMEELAETTGQSIPGFDELVDRIIDTDAATSKLKSTMEAHRKISEKTKETISDTSTSFEEMIQSSLKIAGAFTMLQSGLTSLSRDLENGTLTMGGFASVLMRTIPALVMMSKELKITAGIKQIKALATDADTVAQLKNIKATAKTSKSTAIQSALNLAAGKTWLFKAKAIWAALAPLIPFKIAVLVLVAAFATLVIAVAAVIRIFQRRREQQLADIANIETEIKRNKELADSLKDLEDSMRALNQRMQEGALSAEEYADAMRNLEQEAQALNAANPSLNLDIRGLNLEGAIAEISDARRRIDNELAQINMEQLERNMSAAHTNRDMRGARAGIAAAGGMLVAGVPGAIAAGGLTAMHDAQEVTREGAAGTLNFRGEGRALRKEIESALADVDPSLFMGTDFFGAEIFDIQGIAENFDVIIARLGGIGTEAAQHFMESMSDIEGFETYLDLHQSVQQAERMVEHMENARQIAAGIGLGDDDTETSMEQQEASLENLNQLNRDRIAAEEQIKSNQDEQLRIQEQINALEAQSGWGQRGRNNEIADLEAAYNRLNMMNAQQQEYLRNVHESEDAIREVDAALWMATQQLRRLNDEGEDISFEDLEHATELVNLGLTNLIGASEEMAAHVRAQMVGSLAGGFEGLIEEFDSEASRVAQSAQVDFMNETIQRTNQLLGDLGMEPIAEISDAFLDLGPAAQEAYLQIANHQIVTAAFEAQRRSIQELEREYYNLSQIDTSGFNLQEHEHHEIRMRNLREQIEANQELYNIQAEQRALDAAETLDRGLDFSVLTEGTIREQMDSFNNLNFQIQLFNETLAGTGIYIEPLPEYFHSLSEAQQRTLLSSREVSMATAQLTVAIRTYGETSMQATIAANNLGQAMARLAGLDFNAIDRHARHLQRLARAGSETARAMAGTRQAALETAVVLARLDRGVAAVCESFEDWQGTLSRLDAGQITRYSIEAMEAFGGMAEAIADIFDISEDLITQDFLEKPFVQAQMAIIGTSDDIDEVRRAILDLNDAVNDMVREESIRQFTDLVSESVQAMQDSIKAAAGGVHSIGQEAGRALSDLHVSLRQFEGTMQDILHLPVGESITNLSQGFIDLFNAQEMSREEFEKWKRAKNASMQEGVDFTVTDILGVGPLLSTTATTSTNVTGEPGFHPERGALLNGTTVTSYQNEYGEPPVIGSVVTMNSGATITRVEGPAPPVAHMSTPPRMRGGGGGGSAQTPDIRSLDTPEFREHQRAENFHEHFADVNREMAIMNREMSRLAAQMDDAWGDHRLQLMERFREQLQRQSLIYADIYRYSKQYLQEAQENIGNMFGEAAIAGRVSLQELIEFELDWPEIFEPHMAELQAFWDDVEALDGIIRFHDDGSVANMNEVLGLITDIDRRAVNLNNSIIEYRGELVRSYQVLQRQIAAYSAEFAALEDPTEIETERYHARRREFDLEAEILEERIASAQLGDHYLDMMRSTASNLNSEFREGVGLVNQMADAAQDAIDAMQSKIRQYVRSQLESINYNLEIRLEINNRDLAMIDWQLGRIGTRSASVAQNLINQAMTFHRANITAMAEAGHQMLDLLENIQGPGAVEAMMAQFGQSREWVEDMIESGEHINLIKGALRDLKNQAISEFKSVVARTDQVISMYIQALGRHLANLDQIVGRLSATMSAAQAVFQGWETAGGRDRNIMQGIGILELQLSNLRAQEQANAIQSAALQNEIGRTHATIGILRRAEADAAAAAARAPNDSAARLLAVQYGSQIDALYDKITQMETTIFNNRMAQADNWAQRIQVLAQQAELAMTNAIRNAGAAFTGQFMDMQQAMQQFNQHVDIDTFFLSNRTLDFELGQMKRRIEREFGDLDLLQIEGLTDDDFMRNYETWLQRVTSMREKARRGELDMTQAQLDILKAEFDLAVEKAKLQEEEEMRQKTTMRLARDASGNWAYVFSDDQDDDHLDDTEARIEEIKHNIYQMHRDAALSHERMWLQIQADMFDFITNINWDLYRENEAYAAHVRRTLANFETLAGKHAGQIEIHNGAISRSFSETSLGYVTGTESIAEANANWIANQYATKNELEGIANNYTAKMDVYKNKLIGFMGEIKGAQGEVVAATAAAAAAMDSDMAAMQAAVQSAVDAMIAALNQLIDTLLELAERLREVLDLKDQMDGPGGGGGPYRSAFDMAQDRNRNQLDQGGRWMDSDIGYAAHGMRGDEAFDRSVRQYAERAGTSPDSFQRFMENAGITKINGQYVRYNPKVNGERPPGHIPGDPRRIPIGQSIEQAYHQWQREQSRGGGGFRFARGGLANFTGPAWLDGTRRSPELVLNPADTQNMLAAVQIMRDGIQQNLRNLGSSRTAQFERQQLDRRMDQLEQQVHITADFPHVTDSNQITLALNGLVNRAAQHRVRPRV